MPRVGVPRAQASATRAAIRRAWREWRMGESNTAGGACNERLPVRYQPTQGVTARAVNARQQRLHDGGQRADRRRPIDQ
jgi:hypothetical protein